MTPNYKLIDIFINQRRQYINVGKSFIIFWIEDFDYQLKELGLIGTILYKLIIQ